MLNGKDTAGNEITVQKKVLSLDLDKPNVPVINSNAGYPVLTSYGVKLDGTTTITYDTRTDIDNYYSVDNGSTWLTYVGSFNMTSGSVIAKSVKKNTGLETTVSKTIGLPSDAMKKEVYDGNDATSNSTTNQYMQIDSDMQGKSIRIKWNGGQSGSSFASVIRFLNENRQEISSVNTIGSTIVSSVYNIPTGTKWIKFEAASFGGNIYEVQTSSEPTFTATNGYMLLTADSMKAIREPYQMVTVKYFPTSIQRLYRIGTTGNWLNYNDQPVSVNQGQTIYAKGIDQYGNETRIISSYTPNVPDAMTKEIYDGNDGTSNSTTNQYMQIDSSMQGRNVRIRWNGGQAGSSFASIIRFLNENSQEISSINTLGSTIVSNIYNVPTNAKWIKFEAASFGGNIYEIQPSNEPRIYANPATWTNERVIVTIDSLSPNYTTKYSFDSLTWYTYTDPISISTNNTTVYAKSLDYAGTTGIVKTLTVTNIDKIGPTITFSNKKLYSDTGKVFGSIIIGANDTGGSNINNIQYVVSNQNYSTPNSGWQTSINGATVINEMLDNINYLWVKATDNAGNVTVSVSDKFDKLVDKIYTLTTSGSVNDSFDNSTLNSTIWGTYAHNAGSQVTAESNQAVIKNFYGYNWTGGGIYTKQIFPATGQLTVEYDWQPGTCYVSSFGFGVAYYNPSSLVRESYYGEATSKILSQVYTYNNGVNTDPNKYVRLGYNGTTYNINLNKWTKYHIIEILDFKNSKYQYFINGGKIVDSALTSTLLNGIGSNFRVEFYKGNYQATSSDKIDNVSIKSETFN